MKKSILIFSIVLTAFSIAAYGYINRPGPETDQKKSLCYKTVTFDNFLEKYTIDVADPDLIYNIDSRFMTTITKEDLHNARSIVDILPKKATQSISSYQDVKVSIINNENDRGEIGEIGEGDALSAAQIKLIQSIDYSTNFFIKADYKQKNEYTGQLQDNYLTYYITVTPEKEAIYAGGKNALISYLKENSRDNTAIIKHDKLQPGKVTFTVTKSAKIANVNLTSTCGYPSVDKALVEMITNMPEKWVPASDSNGESVDQELVFFFGLQGC